MILSDGEQRKKVTSMSPVLSLKIPRSGEPAEGGQYRVTLHTVAGALGGGLGGAVGAAVSGASADVLQALQDNLQQGLESAGLNDAAARPS